MIRSSHKLLGALLLLAAVGVGCHRTESDNPVVRPPVDYALQPIDLLLKIQQNEEDQAAQDPFIAPQLQSITQEEGQSFSITRTIATRSRADDDAINNYNIFLFHKTRDSIVRHYYGVFTGDDIRLKNLYVGDYRLYIVVNNGPIGGCNHPNHWGCTYRNADMSNLMSSIIPLPQKSTNSYFSLMVYSDDNFRILHENQKLEVKLKRLTSKIAININSTLPSAPATGVTEYLKFENYSIINMPRQTLLFGDYRPMRQDLGQATNYLPKFSDNTEFTVLNNMQGDGWALGSAPEPEKERNSLNAPSEATCLRIYATYYIKDSLLRNISYLLYLGGDEPNNYDMQAGVEYNYNINFKSPDFADPRVASFTVLDKDDTFKNGVGTDDYFAVDEVISRPLTVEYTKLFDNDSLFVSCIQSWLDTEQFKYNVSVRVGDTYEPLYTGEQGKSKTNIHVPTTKTPLGMDRAELKITYKQNVDGIAILFLRLSTTNGQTYLLPQQEITYY